MKEGTVTWPDAIAKDMFDQDKAHSRPSHACLINLAPQTVNPYAYIIGHILIFCQY